VLFLDEPTTGLDPRSRADVWRHVRDLVTEGTTVLLTTQYLNEADRLADLVAVVSGGRVVTEGTPAELKSRLGQDRLDVVVRNAQDLDRAAAVIRAVTSSTPTLDREARRISAPVHGDGEPIVAAVRELDRAAVALADVALRRPTLDDVFLQLTAAPAAEVEAVA
jgi:ABC-2 type transport system ATP-binding protein